LATTSRSLSHPVGFELHHQRQRLLGEVLHVVGPVEEGRRVGLGAGCLEAPVELAPRHVLRLVEHEMLEQVSDARASLALVPGADTEPGLVADHRCLTIYRHQQFQAVVQLETLYRHPRPERMGGPVMDPVRDRYVVHDDKLITRVVAAAKWPRCCRAPGAG